MDHRSDHHVDVADVTHSSNNSSATTEKSANVVLSLFRRFLRPDDKDAPQTAMPRTGASPRREPSQPQQQRQPGRGGAESVIASTPLPNARQRRLKVAVVGEAESGRTTLCKSLAEAAVRKTPHPLVVSGHAAALRMDASVLSVQTFNVACDRASTERVAEEVGDAEEATVEVTVVDSGPAPFSEGAGASAVMEADVVLLCFPLYGIKQVLAASSSSISRRTTEAFIHTRDYQRLTTLLTLLSSRTGAAGDPLSLSTPTVLLVGTFQDALTDASVGATHVILRSLQRLCDRVRQRAPTMLRLAGVYAVSATEATAVSLSSEKHLTLVQWWRSILHRAETAALTSALPLQPQSPLSSSPTPREDGTGTPSLVPHLLGHPSRLLALNTGMRVLCHGHSSPRFLNVNAATAEASAHAAPLEPASAETRAEDARVTSLVIDFVTQLKERRRVWLLPLPRLWRVAYALGMQTREQLYLVLRQMEATGELSLLGRGLAYSQQSRVASFAVTNETVCLCPALLRTSYAILYVYVDAVVHRQQRHVRRCLRGVSLDACAVQDPHGQARKGVFPLSLLEMLAVALGLKSTSAKEAAELLVAVLVGADAAYIDHQEEEKKSGPLATAGAATHLNDPLTAPLFLYTPSSASSSRAESPSASARGLAADGAAVSPSRRRGGDAGDASLPVVETTVDAVMSVSSSAAEFSSLSSPAKASQVEADHGTFSSTVTVAELTSLFLLGELTAAPPEDAERSDARLSTASLSNASFDPVRWALQQQRTDSRSAAARRAVATEDDGVVLVVPSLQPSALCPNTVVQHVLRLARCTASPLGGSRKSLRSTQMVLRVSPSPYDLVPVLTCRFASVARRVERAHANAVLLSFHVGHLLHPATDHVPLFPHRSATTNSTSTSATQSPVDGSCFLFSDLPPSDAAQSCSTVLHLVCFAASPARVALLEAALCTELRMVFLQRFPGVTIAPEQLSHRADAAVEDSVGMDCATVEELIHFLQDAA